MYRSSLLGYFLLFFYQMAFSQNVIQQKIDQLSLDPLLKNASMGVAVYEVESGKLIAGYQEDKSLIPASSLKVITTATALAILGEDYQFKTTLEYDGTLSSDGVLNGNLYIKGYGDPTLGSSFYEETKDLDQLMDNFIKAVQAAGIKKINGQIVGDASYFETDVMGRTWIYEDMGNYFGAGAWGLNINENTYYLDFNQNPKTGGLTTVKQTRPTIPNLMLINEVKSGAAGSGDNAYIYGTPYGYTRFVRGSIPPGSGVFTIKGSIPDPPFLTAHYMMKKLEAVNISVEKEATSYFEMQRTGLKSTNRTTIFTHLSPTLQTIVKQTNLKSVNLYCEAMLRVMGKMKKGLGSADAGLEVIEAFWRDRGVNLEGFFIKDGSGLSPRNNITTRQLATVLRKVYKDAKLQQAFFDSLPIGGKTGGLKNLITSSKAIGNIRAKSGYMDRVRSYTGYAKNAKGHWLSFSIMVNNHSDDRAVRKKMIKLIESFCN